MRASEFMAYINAEPNEIDVHKHTRYSKQGEKQQWQTVSINGYELTGFILTDKLKQARKTYQKNIQDENLLPLLSNERPIK